MATRQEVTSEKLESTARREIAVHEARVERRWLMRVGYALRRAVVRAFDDKEMPRFRRPKVDRAGMKGDK